MDNLSKQIVLVILNYKTPELTISNASLAHEHNPGVKVVIVDNNSPDDSYLKIKKHFETEGDVHVINSNENGGYSKGNNCGVRYALKTFSDIEYISIMNPDVRIDRDNLLLKMATLLRNDLHLAVLAPIMIQNGRLVLNKMAWKCDDIKRIIQKRSFLANKFLRKVNSYSEYSVSDEKVAYCEVVQGSFFIIKRQVFEQVGFFDENLFLYSEENVLGTKIKELGLSEGVWLESTYLHEHKKVCSSMAQEKAVLKQEFISSEYYCQNYLKCNKVMLILIKICGGIYLNIEFPLVHIVRRFKS